MRKVFCNLHKYIDNYYKETMYANSSFIIFNKKQ